MSIIQNLWAAVGAPWQRRWRTAADVDSIDQSIGNGYDFTWRDSTDTNDIPVLAVSTTNQVMVGSAVQNPVREPIVCHIYPNASLASQGFYLNPTPHAVTLTGMSLVYKTAGSNTAPPTITVTHETQVAGLMQSPGTGKAVLSTALSVHATAATVQNGTLAANYRRESRNVNVANTAPGTGLIVIQPGDALSISFTGTLTALVSVVVTLYVHPGSRYHFVSYYANAAGIQATCSLMTALRPRKLLYGAAYWTVKNGSASTLDITKDASATAAGAGTSMLASTVDMTGTALTYNQMTLSATAANLAIGPTDSVAAKVSSATALAGLVVTLAFEGMQGEVSVHNNTAISLMPLTATINEEFFIADRYYEVLDVSAKWDGAATTATLTVTLDTGTQTPSTGTNVLTGTLDLSGAAATPTFGTLAVLRNRYLSPGDRVGQLVTITSAGSLSNIQTTVRLRAM